MGRKMRQTKLRRTQLAGVAGAIAPRIVAALLVALLAVTPALAERTKLKPGVNMFSLEQDVQIGAENAKQADQQLPVVNDARMTGYLNRLGKRLAAAAPGPKFNYTFKLVNDKSINAFALPGGFLYVNRGVVEAADNEAQLAGVIGHEIGHAALRHGTNQVTKAQFAQSLLGLAGAFGGGGTAAQLATQLGGAFTAQSILLKFSRDAERQADLIGTQILYDNGYDPRAMAQFFEKLAGEEKRGRPPQFFSSHPNPENRSAKVTDEIEKLGGVPGNAKRDSMEFREFKRLVASLPPPPKSGKGTGATKPSSSGQTPARPSSRVQPFEGRLLVLNFPQNWEILGGQEGEVSGVTLAPEGGVIEDQNGRAALAYGMIVGVFRPQTDRRGSFTLEDATDQFIQATQQNNQRMRVDSRRNRIRMDGQPALSVYFENESPTQGRELGWLVTVAHREGLIYFIGVAPDRDYDPYEEAFQVILGSVRFRR
jgi:Zn-dependent protease with chaperone function